MLLSLTTDFPLRYTLLSLGLAAAVGTTSLAGGVSDRENRIKSGSRHR